MKENEIRRIINAYSRKTTDHPFTDYGDKIKIRVNDDCTVYECSVQTQYEDRNVEEKQRPYRGWQIQPRKYFSIHDVAAWNYNLRVPEDFTKRETVVDVDGSARVEQCFPCSGAGSNTCYTCFGKGKEKCPTCGGDYQHLRCSSCGGDGKRNCTSCGGSGEHVCSKCNGTGKRVENLSKWKTHYDHNLNREVGGYEWVKETVSCSACSGRGRWRCESCKGTGCKSCTTCGGRGYVTCPECTQGVIICKTCGGDGKLTCTVCEGAGKNEFRYVVNRSLKEETLRSYVCDNRVREFVENNSLRYSAVDFNVRKKALEGELYPEDVRCSSKLSKLVAKTEPASGKILFQEATVQHVETTVVEYEYDGSSYSGIACGGVFYTDNSPIAEWSAGLVEKAGKKIKLGGSASSLKMLEQARNAGADSREVNNLLAKARRKLGNLREAGVSLAFWLVILFVSPVIYNFYAQLNPVGPWAIVTNNPAWKFFNMVPFCQTILYLLAVLLIRFPVTGYLAEKSSDHSSNWTYFLEGFGQFLLVAFLMTLVFLFVNYMGLSIITTFIMGVILIIIAFFVVMAVLLFRWIVGLFA